MYAFIRGKVDSKTPESVVLDVNGIGYAILAGTRLLSALPEAGETALIYTYLHVREDAQLLYGFSSREEKAMFLKLLGVTGVGPKLAMSILSGLTVAELAIALATSDVRALSRVSGVGKKTAERLVLELRESISTQDLAAVGGADTSNALGNDAGQEAIAGLMALGYSSVEATKAVSAAGVVGSVEDIILRALKALDRR